MQRGALILFSVLFFSSVRVLSAAGGGPEAAVPAVSLTDSLGREVLFDTYPERVLLAGKAVVFSTNTIYMFPAAARFVIGTGTTDQGLGDFYPIIEPNAHEKLRFPNNVGPEQLMTARPDVVILKHYLRESLGAPLEALEIPVVYFNSETPESFYSDIAMFGALLDDDARAREIIGYYQSKYASVIDKTRNAERPRVLLVSYSKVAGETAFSVPSSGWLQTRIVEDGGGTPVWKSDNPGDGWKRINLEQVAVWDPAYIFVVSYTTPARKAVDDFSDRLGLGMLDGEILPFPADFYSWDQPDVRWILALLWTAQVLHPELFAETDLEEEIRYFYSFLYGLDHGTIEREILPRITLSLSSAR